LHYFGVWGYFWGILLVRAQNLTSYSCSATPISYKGDEISRLSRLVVETPILGFLGVFGVLGYLPTSDAKSDVILLLSDPDFLQGWRNFARISRSFRDLTRDRQTTDAATKTEGSYTKCASLKIKNVSRRCVGTSREFVRNMLRVQDNVNHELEFCSYWHCWYGFHT